MRVALKAIGLLCILFILQILFLIGAYLYEASALSVFLKLAVMCMAMLAAILCFYRSMARPIQRYLNAESINLIQYFDAQKEMYIGLDNGKVLKVRRLSEWTTNRLFICALVDVEEGGKVEVKKLLVFRDQIGAEEFRRLRVLFNWLPSALT